MPYLSKKEMDEIVQQHSHLQVGQSERVNHTSTDCSGSSNSMVVRRTDDGYTAKCFRCGNSGKRTLHGVSSLKSKIRGSGGETHDGRFCTSRRIEQRLGDVCESISKQDGRIVERLGEFGIHGKVWINKYGITEHEVMTYGICYDLQEDSIIFPTFDADGLAGFQERCLLPGYNGPKYLSYFLRPAVQLCASAGADMAGLVLVEDFVSAVKVGRVMQAMPVRSTNLSPLQKRAILDSDWRNYIVWFDNDNSIVKRNQLALKRELDKIGRAEIIKTGNDPKAYTTNEIISIIYGDH